jgi:hypothetical protein
LVDPSSICILLKSPGHQAGAFFISATIILVRPVLALFGVVGVSEPSAAGWNRRPWWRGFLILVLHRSIIAHVKILLWEGFIPANNI